MTKMHVAATRLSANDISGEEGYLERDFFYRPY